MPLSITTGDAQLVTRQGLREPQLFKASCGDLLLTYHVQPDTHFAERHGLRSRDGGRTWQAEPRRAHREQCIGEGEGGVVLAYDIYTFERRPGEYVGAYYRSEDGGRSFSGPHETTVFINRVASREYPTPEHIPPEGHPLRKFFQPLPGWYEPIVAKSSRREGPHFWRYPIEHGGRWLAAMVCKYHGDRVNRTVLVASEDSGRTWRYLSDIGCDEEARDGLCEPVLAATPDGALLCVMRRAGGLPLAQSRSHDGGKNWCRFELLPGHGVDPDLHLMSNGVLACTYGRPGLHIMFSEDGCGYSWGYRTVVGEWRSSTYMGIAEVAPGELLLIHDQCESNEEGSGRDPSKCLIGSKRFHVRRNSFPA